VPRRGSPCASWLREPQRWSTPSWSIGAIRPITSSRSSEPPVARSVRRMTTPDEREPDGYDLIISSKPIDGPGFNAQTELIKSSGAGFDGYSRTWLLPLERALTGDRPGLEVLFEAAREYGTSVWLRPRHRQDLAASSE